MRQFTVLVSFFAYLPRKPSLYVSKPAVSGCLRSLTCGPQMILSPLDKYCSEVPCVRQTLILLYYLIYHSI